MRGRSDGGLVESPMTSGESEAGATFDAAEWLPLFLSTMNPTFLRKETTSFPVKDGNLLIKQFSGHQKDG